MNGVMDGTMNDGCVSGVYDGKLMGWFRDEWDDGWVKGRSEGCSRKMDQL